MNANTITATTTTSANSWMTLPKLPKERTEFGMTRLDDYGQDDLFPIIVEFHGAVDPASLDRLDLDVAHLLGEDEVERYAGPPLHHEVVVTNSSITALLDDDAPAKVAPLTERMPDFIDSGMAWWIGSDAAVGCPVEMEPHAGSIAERGGWLGRTGNYPAMYGFVVMPHNREEVLTGPLSHNGEQYALWRMVQDAVLPQEG